MNGKRLLCITSIIHTFLGIALFGFSTYTIISSNLINPANDMYGESRGFGIFLGIIMLVFSIPIIATGVVGLTNYKKPNRGYLFIAIGSIWLLAQLLFFGSAPISLLGAIFPTLYLIGGILAVKSDKKSSELNMQPTSTPYFQ